ncbi:MAG: hypothetical protein VCC00_08950 [Deltaproteobacteria bacterium]
MTRHGLLRGCAQLLLAIGFLCAQRASLAQADVGAMVARGIAGDLHWTLFVESPGLVSGESELGLLLQSPAPPRHAAVAAHPGRAAGAILLGPRVQLRAEAPDGSAQTRAARPGFAGNHMIYAAPIFFHQIGDWRFVWEVERVGREPLPIEISLPITAGPSLWLRAWPWLAFPALVVLLYLLAARRGRPAEARCSQST